MKTAKLVADLPDEVITTHILPRLPAKSVGRCRCVSKPWRSLLSSPEFAKTHLKSHADEPENLIMQFRKALNILNFTGGDGHIDAISRLVNFPTSKVFSDDAVPQKVKLPLGSLVVGSCDGLILIATNMKYSALVLVNPITLEFAKFPQVSYPRGKFRTFGLGYDSSSDDYKIVKLSESSDRHGSQKRVDVYSVKMKCWRTIGHTPYRDYDCESKSGVYLNGCIHWMADKSSSVAAFDLAWEKFVKIPLPSGGVVNKEHSLEIKVFEGRLSLIYQGGVFSRRGSADVWVMEEYGVPNSWTKLTTLNWTKLATIFDYRVKCMLSGDEILVEWNDMQLLAYNWRSEVWREVAIAGYKGSLGRPNIMAFRESIVSISALTSLT